MSTEIEEVLDKRQLSEMLHVSERTVERWITESRIPYIRLPKRGAWSEIRFLKSTILIWLKKSEHKVTNKLAKEVEREED
jgi:phage terminase Nu1 subunit (DNA packaging protein)